MTKRKSRAIRNAREDDRDALVSISIRTIRASYSAFLGADSVAEWIAGGAVCVTEVAAREDFAAPAGFDVLEERTYGAARVVFLRRAG